MLWPRANSAPHVDRVFRWAMALLLPMVMTGCSLQINRFFRALVGEEKSNLVFPDGGTYQRDQYGILHITAPNYGALGCGVGRSQVDAYGLELQLLYALYSPNPTAVFGVDDQVVQHILPGQIRSYLQFDQNGFPKPSHLRDPAIHISDIEKSNHYIGLHQWVSDTMARIQNGQSGPLKEYLEGFVSCANRRFATRANEFMTSTNPRTQYLVSRGLHTRQVTIRDTIAGTAGPAVDFTVGEHQTWVNYIPLLPSPPSQHARISGGGRTQAQLFTASNELGITGRAMASNRAAIVLDPHLPIQGPWDHRKIPMVLWIPGVIKMDVGLAFGAAFPTIGHAHHLDTDTHVAYAGTSNAHTPSNAWYAPTTPDLERYSSNLTPNQGLTPFTTTVIDGMTVRTGTHGRLIGYRPDWGFGFMMKIAGDGNHTMIESFWAMLRAHNFTEFLAALDLKQLPYWHIIVGISGGNGPSGILYISNQVSAVRDPNPDNNLNTTTEWNGFLPADDPKFNWSNQLHTASELPQRYIAGEPTDPLYLHCHNCTASIHDSTSMARPYLYGGYSTTNYRQKAGDLIYAQEITPGRKLALTDLIPLVNHKRDLNLEEIVSKLDATFLAHQNSLAPSTRAAAANELARWKAGPVMGTLDNTRIARILYWQHLMMTSGIQFTGADLLRIVVGYILIEQDPLFSPNTPLALGEAGYVFEKLAQVNLTFASQFGSDDVPWGALQMLRTAFGGFPVPGSPHALMSMNGAFRFDSNLNQTSFGLTVGQNFVMLSDGEKSLVRTSLNGTASSEPYAATLSTLYAAEQFVPMGVGRGPLSEEEIAYKETIEYHP